MGVSLQLFSQEEEMKCEEQIEELAVMIYLSSSLFFQDVSPT